MAKRVAETLLLLLQITNTWRANLLRRGSVVDHCLACPHLGARVLSDLLSKQKPGNSPGPARARVPEAPASYRVPFATVRSAQHGDGAAWREILEAHL